MAELLLVLTCVLASSTVASHTESGRSASPVFDRHHRGNDIMKADRDRHYDMIKAARHQKISETCKQSPTTPGDTDPLSVDNRGQDVGTFEMELSAAERNMMLSGARSLRGGAEERTYEEGGRIEMIVGPMFAGKSTELMRRIRRHKVRARAHTHPHNIL